MLYSSDYQTPGGNRDVPTDVPDPSVPPVGDPSEDIPAPVPEQEPDVGIKLPGNTDRDLTEDFPDTEDERPGREDPNITEDEEREGG